MKIPSADPPRCLLAGTHPRRLALFDHMGLLLCAEHGWRAHVSKSRDWRGVWGYAPPEVDIARHWRMRNAPPGWPGVP